MIKKIFKLFKILEIHDRKKLITLFFLTIIAMIIEVSSIITFLPLVSEFLESGEKFYFLKNIIFFKGIDYIYILIFLFLSIHFFKFLYLFFFYYTQNKFINNLSANLTVRLFNKYLYQGYEIQTNNKTSVMIRNLITETKMVCSSFVSPVFIIIIEIITISGIVILLFFFKPDIALITGVLFFFLILFYSLSIKKHFLIWGSARQFLNNMSLKIGLNVLNGIKDIMIYSKENFFKFKFNQNETEFARVSKFYQTFQQLPRLVLEFIFIFFLIFLIIYLKTQNLSSNEIIEIASIFAISGVKIIPSASKIIGSFQMLKFGIPALESIINEDIKSIDHYRQEHFNKCLNYNFKDSIILNNISFAYQKNNKQLIFENLNFKIEKNKIIGIFGNSGSGKSTFVDILSGLLAPVSGSILIDGKNIGKNSKLLRSIFAYVPQNVFILDDTIKNNIVFGENDNEIDIERLNNAIHQSQLKYFIESLPKGVNTIVGERGSVISGGQIQRIGIARAIYHNAEVLIFDESTNALDENTENQIIEEIKQLKKFKTTIIISHNIKILQICDNIYELKNKTLNIKI